MIAAGRRVVTRAHVEQLPGTLPALNGPYVGGRSMRLFDLDQVLAAVQGEDLPRLDTLTDDPADLFAARHASAYLGVGNIHRLMTRFRRSGGDTVLYGVAFWYRSTLDAVAVTRGRSGSAEPPTVRAGRHIVSSNEIMAVPTALRPVHRWPAHPASRTLYDVGQVIALLRGEHPPSLMDLPARPDDLLTLDEAAHELSASVSLVRTYLDRVSVQRGAALIHTVEGIEHVRRETVAAIAAALPRRPAGRPSAARISGRDKVKAALKVAIERGEPNISLRALAELADVAYPTAYKWRDELLTELGISPH